MYVCMYVCVYACACVIVCMRAHVCVRVRVRVHVCCIQNHMELCLPLFLPNLVFHESSQLSVHNSRCSF